MDSLKNLCEESLISHDLNLETAADLLHFATIYDAAKLKTAVMDLVEK